MKKLVNLVILPSDQSIEPCAQVNALLITIKLKALITHLAYRLLMKQDLKLAERNAGNFLYSRYCQTLMDLYGNHVVQFPDPPRL